MSTALWCVKWRRLRGALNVDGFVVRWMVTALWYVGNEADGEIEPDGARLMRPMMLKRPSPAGKADEAEEAITGVTSK